MLTDQLATDLGQQLLKRHWQCTVAESCTGGSLAAAITDCPGSSQWFTCGFVTYSNEAKQRMLGVAANTLIRFGAVSEETAREMAEGALRKSAVQVSAAITGVAGPGGGSLKKPVGTVWIAWASEFQPTLAQCYHFDGDRLIIRGQAVNAALDGLIALTRRET